MGIFKQGDMYEKCTWPIPEDDLMRRLDLGQKMYAGLLGIILRAVHQKYGEEAYEVIFEAVRKWDFWKELAEKVGCPIGTASPDQWNQVGITIDRCMFISAPPKIMEQLSTPEKTVCHIDACNVADIICETSGGDVCSVISRAIEQGSAEVVNPYIKVGGHKVLGKGDETCEVTLALKKMPQTSKGYWFREEE